MIVLRVTGPQPVNLLEQQDGMQLTPVSLQPPILQSEALQLSPVSFQPPILQSEALREFHQHFEGSSESVCYCIQIFYPRSNFLSTSSVLDKDPSTYL
jgi:hypothetical protein